MSSATYRLTRIHRSLDDAITTEARRRMPNSLKLLRLKRLRLAVKDRLAVHAGAAVEVTGRARVGDPRPFRPRARRDRTMAVAKGGSGGGRRAVARATGFEPATPGLEGSCSIRPIHGKCRPAHHRLRCPL